MKEDNGGVGGLKESKRKRKGAKQVYLLLIGICPLSKCKAVEKVTTVSHLQDFSLGAASA